MTIEEFVFNTPLYHVVRQGSGFEHLAQLLVKQNKEIEIEGYNPIKKCDTTYYLHKGIGELQQYSNFGLEYYIHTDSFLYFPDLISKDGVRSIVLKCKRYGDSITILLLYCASRGFIMKIGQYPSVADIHIGQVKQYDKVLDKSILREFTKAIGLAANGVGIGSFVYLRRIFENLVYDAFDEAKREGGLDLELFNKQRMDEKIKSLKGYLPPFIVQHSAIYGILSKGIHELSEEECLEYFDTMRASIEMILDQRVEQREKKKKEEEVQKRIDAINSKLKE